MDQNTPIRVSYLITTRNRAQFLQRTLDNVREFITPEDELIIFDAASTDETQLVAEKNKDIITLFVSEPDKGEAHGFNKGILASRGKYIKFLSDDDYFYPDVMQRSIQFLEENSDIDAIICGGEAYVSNRETNEWELLKYSYLPEDRTMRDNFFSGFNYVFCGLGLFISKKAIEMVGLLDTSYISVDLEYIARLTFSSINFRYLNINLFKHYRHVHSSSLGFSKAQEESIRLALEYAMQPKPLEYLDPQTVCKTLMRNYDCFGLRMAEFILTANSMRRSKIQRPILALVIFGKNCMECYGKLVSIVCKYFYPAQKVIDGPKVFSSNWNPFYEERIQL